MKIKISEKYLGILPFLIFAFVGTIFLIPGILFTLSETAWVKGEKIHTTAVRYQSGRRSKVYGETFLWLQN